VIRRQIVLGHTFEMRNELVASSPPAVPRGCRLATNYTRERAASHSTIRRRAHGYWSRVIKVHAMGVTPQTGFQAEIRSIDQAGMDGVFATDHLFISHGKPRRDALAGGDPFVRLGIAGTLSERLMLGTSVVNIGFAHPALALRSFLELATQFGGDRVLAGIGAGWNREEFESLGMEFPPLGRRMDRLEEGARLARALFDEGFADFAGEHVTASELTLGPPPSPPPRLLLGGGSDRLLEIAGRYADIVDLNGSSRRLKLGGPHPVLRDAMRRFTTTVADLEESVARVRASAAAARRDGDQIEFSVLVNAIRFCAISDVDSVESELCEKAGIEHQSLADCPYVFVGPPERMRDQLSERAERLGLRHLILTPDEINILARFRQDVVVEAAG
jgi:alkanesulfonate monooxygenase SsuD/methylene tetrahydromethanopterin reductase-like flavin-dependent oxidoreductase (luciferase family)